MSSRLFPKHVTFPRHVSTGIFFVIAFSGWLISVLGAPFPPLYPDRAPFDQAIRESNGEALSQPVTGITVPHHLLAIDLIADVFQRIRNLSCRRIIILGPDHFSRSVTPFAVCDRDLMTCCGLVRIASSDVGELLKLPLVSSSSLFFHEHAVQAVVPFCARFFPDIPVLAIAIRNNSRRSDWDALYNLLAPLAGTGTLVIQSTDFSHFLAASEARKCDQETLSVLGSQNATRAGELSQPRNIDSRGALYLQMRLQREVSRAVPMVLANRNSQEYSPLPVARTTSYIVALYFPISLSSPDMPGNR
ncbi:MAG: AmmeMemoRadiSam system protein B [Candidatus Riflebacteria bacterium]|nr:AmmeMemoRadiSam system protein B [Candidatus Riflebacteria bacterium]